jgi:HEPN domain-containing protein
MAKGNLKLAAVSDSEVPLEELCYNAQQAAEKAVKAVFVKLRRPFPYTHNLAHLLDRLAEAGINIAPEVWRSVDFDPICVRSALPQCWSRGYRGAASTISANSPSYSIVGRVPGHRKELNINFDSRRSWLID